MPLPGIIAPAGTPSFLAAGHAILEGSLFAVNRPATGHRRMRRLFTVPERSVPVSWRLNAAQMAVIDNWFEDTLQAGSLFFSAQIKDQLTSGLLWWKAKWAAPYQAEPLTGGFWRVTGSVQLFGTGTTTAPAVSALAVDYGAALVASARIYVDIPLVSAYGAALTPSGELPLVGYGAALLPPANTDRRARAFFFPGEHGIAAFGGNAEASALAFME